MENTPISEYDILYTEEAVQDIEDKADYIYYHLILIPNQNIQFAAVFLASCHVKRLGNTYSIPCDVFLA